ncbi:DNA-binding SARP family transcriptional activator [Allocatelliglobosispora scoriae]|uniref:DNA-binding SARP family transcriptional activator n=1 Tax=Allocatelliglobosispora scoriae TaxID=643052 RepID=A0A841BXU8_9ACTN|nr:LysM peptidoglycan-binding domain-containing protein [Allocatelliglobosispora scoriae]MBB5871959.1 DNA-binding SARP family transcriptional activator [Allocatelliglobosispora scoriae]
MAWVRRLIAAIANTVLVVVFVIGPPAAFVYYDAASILQQLALHDSGDVRPSARQAAPLMIVSIGVLWLLLIASMLVELSGRVRGVKAPRISYLPLHGLASMLVAGQAITLLSPAAASASTVAPPVQPSAVQAAIPVTAATTGHQQDTDAVPTRKPHAFYVVKKGDYLSKIARKNLGNSHRWTEICDLNRHRHFKVGGTLHDCDLIYPGWDLRLPADARSPYGAAPVKPPTTRTPPPVLTPPTPAPSTTPSSPAVASSPSITVNPGVDSPVIGPSARVSPSAPASPSPITSSGPSTSASPAASDSESPQVTIDEHGVQLSPSSWLPWGLALAISAAVVLVWLQRRRHFTGPDDDPPTLLPEPVVTVRRAVARNPRLVRADIDDAETPALGPDLTPLPSGGTGITGDGASAAARAALVTVLASGGPYRADARGEVVIDAATLATLLGSDVVTLGAWSRLHVVDSVDDALTMIESRLLHRSRILDEHALTDLDELRQRVPDEEALPPVMLITDTPPAGARMRAKVALALGGGLDVSALLLGEWAHGATVEVAPDGYTKLVAGQSTEPVPTRLPVLDPAAAIQILTTLREAQTGEQLAIVPSAVPVVVVPLHASRVTPASAEPQLPAGVPAVPVAAAGPVKAKLRVIGSPRIDGIVHDGRALRAKAKELAVFLAVHPDGVETRTIGDNIELDARISQAAQRVHTNASNLRHVLGRAAVLETPNAYVVKSGGRYKLDPATVDVDVWTLRDLMRKATIASGPARRELLTAACDLYTAPLAEGADYEWLAPHRETVRRWGTEAHLLLADCLLDSHPQEASDLLDKAIGLDRYNEALYVKAMHARHSLGDADGIRTLLRALTKALADLDAEPQDDTRSLASKLRTSLEQK